MRKIYLEQVKQHNSVFYIGKYDPRKLVRMADQSIVAGTIQEAQRPLDKTHLKEIADFAVGQEGLLPASVMIATKNKQKLSVEEEIIDGVAYYYIMFPDTEDELKDYDNTIDVIDGQHRLYSFKDEYINIGFQDSEPYELPFSLFEVPSLRTRQLLFTITNEKQKAVGKNLLLYLKRKLGMLSPAENTYYPIVEKLNEENMSPLKGRIVMSAEKIKKGYKSTELIKIFDKVKLTDLIQEQDPDQKLQKLLKIVSTYLLGWQEFYGVDFQNPGKETITKISGIRYIMFLLQTFWDHATNSKQAWDVNFIKTTIQDLEDLKVIPEEGTLFDDSQIFRGESATVSEAISDSSALKNYLASKTTDNFDPLA